MMSPESSKKSQTVEIPFSGKSMYPCIRTGDILIAELFAKPISSQEFKPGSLLLHRDQSELMIHRLNDRFLFSSDWHRSNWHGDVYGKVSRIVRDGHQIPIQFTTAYKYFSSWTDRKIRFQRWVGKFGLLSINLIERICTPKNL